MNIQETLSTLAEVAMTLAGFTGLVIALAPTENHSTQALFRVSAIIAGCFILVISALLPAPLLLQGFSERVAFGIAMVLLSVGFMGVGISISIAGRRGIFVSATPRFSLALRVPSYFFAFFLIAAPIFDLVSSMAALLVFSLLWFASVTGAYFILSIMWVIQIQAEGGERKLGSGAPPGL